MTWLMYGEVVVQGGKDGVAAGEIVVWESVKAGWTKSGNLDLEAAPQGIRRDLTPFQDQGEVGIRLEENGEQEQETQSSVGGQRFSEVDDDDADG